MSLLSSMISDCDRDTKPRTLVPWQPGVPKSRGRCHPGRIGRRYHPDAAQDRRELISGQSFAACDVYLTLVLACPGSLLAAAKRGPELPDPGDVGVSKEDQIQLGQKFTGEVYKQMPVLPDNSSETKYVRKLGQRLVATIPPETSWPFEFHVIPQKEINAFALPGGPIFINVGTINSAANEAQLAGVIAHEMSHVYNRDILTSSVAAAFAGMITSVAQFLMFFGGGDRREGGNPIAMLAMVFLSPIAAMLIQLAISRTREYDADEDGARLTGDPLALASALAKLEQGTRRAPLAPNRDLVDVSHLMIANPFRGGGMASMFATHPPMADRIQRLQRMAGEQGPITRY